jgi:transposase
LAAIKGEKILIELAQEFDVHANQITQWKSQLLEGAVGVFGGEEKVESAAVDVKTLHANSDELTLENDFVTDVTQRSSFEAVRRMLIGKR